jgi:hypothetical protein
MLCYLWFYHSLYVCLQQISTNFPTVWFLRSVSKQDIFAHCSYDPYAGGRRFKEVLAIFTNYVICCQWSKFWEYCSAVTWNLSAITVLSDLLCICWCQIYTIQFMRFRFATWNSSCRDLVTDSQFQIIESINSVLSELILIHPNNRNLRRITIPEFYFGSAFGLPGPP